MLVPRGSVDDLANALELLVRNSEMRSAMGQSGYRSFKRNFTWTAVRREYTALLQSLTTCSNLAHSV
jgi:glycosyltransferase involved in cell wall biosynthesis